MAFLKTKEEISKNVTLPYFNPGRDTTLQTDTSKEELGAVILQDASKKGLGAVILQNASKEELGAVILQNSKTMVCHANAYVRQD